MPRAAHRLMRRALFTTVGGVCRQCAQRLGGSAVQFPLDISSNQMPAQHARATIGHPEG
jgi:hypothetical protein